MIGRIAIESLRRWLQHPDWVSADVVPDELSRLRILVIQQRPFAILNTDVVSGDTEESISATVDLIVEAHAASWICSPLSLSYRPARGELLRSDLAVLIYKEPSADIGGDSAGDLEGLRSFVVQSLQNLDHKNAVIAGAKRTGRLSERGEFRNSFRTTKMTPLLLRRYLSLIYGKSYCLLEYSIERSGIWSRASWEGRGVQPAVLYGGKDIWRKHTPDFQFGRFPLE